MRDRNSHQAQEGRTLAIDAMPPTKPMSKVERFVLGIVIILAPVASFLLVIGFGLIWSRP
jgi:hypothetical protein